MLEQLLQWDTEVFLLINKEGGNAFFDVLMPILRNKFTWIPLYILILFGFYKMYGLKNAGIILVFAALLVVVGDSLITDTTKHTVKRLRPCQEESLKDKMVERVGCGGMYGYFSAHATNHFALALLFSLLLKKRFRWATFALLFWAAAISYAQVYVGKHYPLDVLTGTIVGCLLAWLTYWGLQKSIKQLRA